MPKISNLNIRQMAPKSNAKMHKLILISFCAVIIWFFSLSDFSVSFSKNTNVLANPRSMIPAKETKNPVTDT